MYPTSRQHQRLKQIDELLTLRIPFDVKVELAAMASVLWPSRKFTGASEVYNRFLAEHKEYVSEALFEIYGEGEVSALLPGVDEYVSEVIDSQMAEDVLNRPHRTVAADDDDVEEVKARKHYYKQLLFNAMVSFPQDTDEKQKEQWVTWRKNLNRTYTLRQLHGICLKLVDDCTDIQEDGCILGGDQNDWCMKDKADRYMKCTERLKTLIKVLSYKLMCKDCLNRQHRLRLVAAPNAVLKKECGYKKNSVVSRGLRKGRSWQGGRRLESRRTQKAPMSPLERQWRPLTMRVMSRRLKLRLMRRLRLSSQGSAQVFLLRLVQRPRSPRLAHGPRSSRNLHDRSRQSPQLQVRARLSMARSGLQRLTLSSHPSRKRKAGRQALLLSKMRQP